MYQVRLEQFFNAEAQRRREAEVIPNTDNQAGTTNTTNVFLQWEICQINNGAL
jgi:hypothetical protein